MSALYDGYLATLFTEAIISLFVIFTGHWGTFVLFKGFTLWPVYWCGARLSINNSLFVLHCILQFVYVFRFGVILAPSTILASRNVYYVFKCLLLCFFKPSCKKYLS